MVTPDKSRGMRINSPVNELAEGGRMQMVYFRLAEPRGASIQTLLRICGIRPMPEGQDLDISIYLTSLPPTKRGVNPLPQYIEDFVVACIALVTQQRQICRK
jgi:hypothetical protein